MSHHGKVVERYRKAQAMTQDELAQALQCHRRTVQNMEEMEEIRSINRRWFLVGLLGIPAIELGLTGSPPWSKKTALAINPDTMSFFENELAMHWKLYKSAGPRVASQNFTAWISQAERFQTLARGTPWSMRAGEVLSMSYQLDGSVKRELKDITGAKKAYSKALIIAEEIGSVENQAATVLRQGLTLYYEKHTNEKAIQYYERALKIITDKPMPRLHGSILQSLAESHAKLKESAQCWRAIELAEHILGREEDSRETNYVQFNKSTIDGYKGSYALYLGDYERAIALLNKSITRPEFSMKNRFMVRKAKALYYQGKIDLAIDIAQEALILTKATGNVSIIHDIEAFHQEIAESRYKHESCVKKLGKALVDSKAKG